MKMDTHRRWLVVTAALLLVGIVGCHEGDSDVGGVFAIIYAVVDLVLGIIQVAS